MVEPRLVFSLPFPLVCPTSFFPLCVHPFPCLVLSSPHVCEWLPHQRCALLCCFVSSLLFLCLFHHHHPSSPLVCETSVWAMAKRMNRRVSSKKRVEKGRKKRNRRPHVVSTPCHQPWSQPHPHTLRFTLLATSPISSCCCSHSFSAVPFWLGDKRRMVCVMSNKHTKVALLFLCQPSFSNHLFLLDTSSLLPLWCCDECACPIHATNETK